jgi:hypothetical protein
VARSTVLSCGGNASNGDCFGGVTGSRAPFGNFLISQHNFSVLTGDAVFNPASGAVDLTDAWTAQVRYRHFWAPTWRSVVGVGYTKVDFTGPGQISSSTATGVSSVPTSRCYRGTQSYIGRPTAISILASQSPTRNSIRAARRTLIACPRHSERNGVSERRRARIDFQLGRRSNARSGEGSRRAADGGA